MSTPYPGAIPVLSWPDGAVLLRIIDQEGYDRWVEPLAGEGSLANDNIAVYHLLFTYLDPSGTPTGATMFVLNSQPPQEPAIIDSAGPNLGPITDPLARRRLLGLIAYRLKHSQELGAFNSMNEDWSYRLPLNVPFFLDDVRLKRARVKSLASVQKEIAYRAEHEPPSLDHHRRMHVAKSLHKSLRAKSLPRAIGIAFPPSGPYIGDFTDDWGDFNWQPSTLDSPHGNVRLVVRIHANGTLQYRIERVRLPDGYTGRRDTLQVPMSALIIESMGKSDKGPAEAMEAGGWLFPESMKEEWLKQNTERGVTELLPVETYLLLGLADPMTWPNAELVAAFADLEG